MEQEKLQSIIESLLFVSGEPVKKAKLMKILTSTIEDVNEAVKNICEKYSKDSSGLTILHKGEELQLVSKSVNAEYIEQMVKNELQDSLSSSAMEVVSIIAYKGPISKTEIEAIRGVNCSYSLRNLLMRGLIERNDNPRDSRGYVYAISFDFLKKLGIDNVEKLPEYDILSKDERISSIASDE